MARPRKTDTDRRDDSLPPVRLTGSERLHVEAQASAAGLTVSDYSRRRVLGHTVAPRRSEADDRLLLELNRIGVNLNQMTMRANTSGAIRSEEILADTLDELRRVFALLISRE